VRAKAIDAALAPLGVHAVHHLTLHRPPRAGDSLRTSARVTRVQRRRAGTLVVVRYTTTDRSGVLVSTTDYGSVYRGVELQGDDVAPPDSARGGRAERVHWEDTVAIPAQAAHVYTEGARIFNPIHTDVAVARAAGLPGIILHGTATLALAVSRVVTRDLGGDPTRVRGVAARFTGMVMMPSTLTVRGHGTADQSIAFDAVTPGGASLLGDGVVLR
jgi:acyl dehydratase